MDFIVSLCDNYLFSIKKRMNFSNVLNKIKFPVRRMKLQFFNSPWQHINLRWHGENNEVCPPTKYRLRNKYGQQAFKQSTKIVTFYHNS